MQEKVTKPRREKITYLKVSKQNGGLNTAPGMFLRGPLDVRGNTKIDANRQTSEKYIYIPSSYREVSS